MCYRGSRKKKEKKRKKKKEGKKYCETQCPEPTFALGNNQLEQQNQTIIGGACASKSPHSRQLSFSLLLDPLHPLYNLAYVGI